MPVLLRGRAFLAPNVPLRVVICQPGALVCVDRHRLNQIITNGLRSVPHLRVCLFSDVLSCMHVCIVLPSAMLGNSRITGK